MQVEIVFLCTLISVTISVATFYIARRQEAKSQSKEDTERIVRIEEKLDSTLQSIEQMQLDDKDFSKGLQKLENRVTIVEQTLKQIKKEE